ncbi:putative Ras-related protein Rab-33 [Octopus bimaculoides]|uniref:small monomeric GTPase n=1 Tax=Octopus bimaculoides TaxID=37653 RepID=A0A0L8H5W5_OCTBM|nr:putative Ras-related protein Rab-33 [Octopus bimaculoides]|eukprot:XP_014775232.1 PREDICTED: putative Ras-related protein Rab-33 [Octopus bimaculoides]
MEERMNTELPTGHELEGSSSAGRYNETTKTILTNTENQTGDVKTTTTVTTSSPSTAPSSKIIEKQAQKRIFKIIVIGDSNVGKTCLTYRFCSGKFPDKTEATIGVDFREKMILVEGEQIKLQLWDTAGQERFRKSMVQHYYRNVHAVVFVYDVTKISSFENMPNWIEECDRHNLNKDIPRILVGNKCDIIDRIAVNTNAAQKFADSHNMPLFETSAKDDEKANHVEAIFMTLAHKLKNSKPMMPSYIPRFTSESSQITNIGCSPDIQQDDGKKDYGCSC